MLARVRTIKRGSAHPSQRSEREREREEREGEKRRESDREERERDSTNEVLKFLKLR
jgi:hypothetical protein